MKKIIWIGWLAVSLAIALYLGKTLLISEEKNTLLIGDASHGHFQIELACDACHTSAFGGTEVLQDACTNCHAEELEEAHDSHPRKKFTDPREAYRLEVIDARYCISCHKEHQREQTNTMGVTLPDDYCYHCHQETREERSSHKDLPFDSCASAGCHNYHDNRALYESFLIENANQPWLSAMPVIPQKTENIKEDHENKALTIASSQYSDKAAQYPSHAQDWASSAHAKSGIDCGGCHINEQDESIWIEKPTLAICEKCHQDEVKGFSSGKHGMRLANAISLPLDAITPGESTLAFQDTALLQEHSCHACHSAHEFNTKKAAVEGCLNCHADEHSLAYNDSPHSDITQQETQGLVAPGSEVTCATCHMPKMETPQGSYINHNQNHNLRPNEKMIRGVCMNCHGLAFSIDALADEDLIKNNFNGKPGTHIESIDWSLQREQRQ